MDTMEREGENLKDIKDNSLNLKDNSISISYNKAHKLITALYMVTDILEKEEPLRSKLRSLGLEILTDISGVKDNYNSQKITVLPGNIDLILSYLNIANTVGIISSMNSSILAGEFSRLKQAILESNIFLKPYGGEASLSDFLQSPSPDSSWRGEEGRGLREGQVYNMSFNPNSGRIRHEGIDSGTRIGIQKGSTLMQALSDKMLPKVSPVSPLPKHREEFDALKKERKDEIILIIKTKNLEQSSKGQALGVTITDIKGMAKNSLKDTSEKTLQRELTSLIEDGVLYKEGAKRWSKYFIK